METTTQEGNGLTMQDVAEQSAEDRKNEITEEKRRFERILPIPLTEHELAERGKTMAGLAKQLDDLEAKRKAVLHELTEERKEIEGQLSSVAREVRAGARHDSVECIEGLDHSEQHMLVQRLDTGEVIERRPLTPEERQGNFAFVEGEDDDEPEDGEEGEGNVVHLRTPPDDDEDTEGDEE